MALVTGVTIRMKNLQPLPLNTLCLAIEQDAEFFLSEKRKQLREKHKLEKKNKFENIMKETF